VPRSAFLEDAREVGGTKTCIGGLANQKAAEPRGAAGKAEQKESVVSRSPQVPRGSSIRVAPAFCGDYFRVASNRNLEGGYGCPVSRRLFPQSDNVTFLIAVNEPLNITSASS
jgi:hypothetical protein